MGLSRIIFPLALILCVPKALFGDFPSPVSCKILYTGQQSIPQALSLYLSALDSYGDHDFSVLRTLSENCLKQGIYASDPYIRKGTIIGSGLAGSSETLDILLHAIETEDPSQQALVLSSLPIHLETKTHELLRKALSSPYPIIRLEAAYRLAHSKDIQVLDHLHAFMHRMPDEIQCLCAAIFLKLESEESDSYIRQLLSSPKPTIRNYVALLIGEYQQKRFAPTLRNLLTSTSPSDQESALYSLGKLKDSQSYPMVKPFLKKQDPDLSLAAAQTLLSLGKEEEALPIFETLIQDLYTPALYSARLLSKEVGIPLLLPIFLTTEHPEKKLNAALALVQLGCDDDRLLQFMTEWLAQPHYTQALLPIFSKGHATQSWKYRGIIPPSTPQEKAKVQETIHAIEERILSSLLQLPKDSYLPYVETILRCQKPNLAAKAIIFLSHSSHHKALEILNKASVLPGEPVIRAYADLALYNKTKNPEKKIALHHYAQTFITETLLFIDIENKQPRSDSPYLCYQVAPEMRTKLMLDILETLVTTKTHEDIRLLIQLMAHTNAKNLPILAGLLLKIIE